MKSVIKINNLSKSFGNVEALKNVDFELREGEIHGLIGANGSGKSTFLNILFGNPKIEETGGYSGEIIVDGDKKKISSPSASIKSGIGMIHQEFALISNMNVAENIKINREQAYGITEKLFGRSFAYINKKKNHEDAQEILNTLGIKLNTNIKVCNLSTSMKQFIEIAREIDKENLKVLMLDEPTAVLNKEDSDTLIEILKGIAKRGTAIIFVSHRLEEVVNLCDKATILRDGEVAAVYDKEEFNIEKIAEDMIGHKVVKVQREKKEISKETILSFENFAVNMPGEEASEVNLNINKGEILGITSLAGHGKMALGYGIMGMYDTEGTVNYKGENLDLNDSGKIIDKGIYMLPDDRKNMGLLLNHSVRDNVIFAALQNKNRFLKRFFIDSLGMLNKKESHEHVEHAIEKFNIKCSSMYQSVRELSGGNQQKVCIARGVALNPEVLFVAEPTRGVDIGAKERILDMLLNINEEKNTTIVIASSELEELKRVCDRILVMYEGKVFKILDPDSDDRDFALALSGERGVMSEAV
ncbi:sugar ABC transporter ATP-binding protein [Oceanirhabdus sp. W0125-5]|uniref:sugar ABC transporter ATP-binding protein n=1 Tax=Oceanirhabdus sp. W0125-5 TaxID=2999116 RepID=UPI0022F2A993|nr:sugar ABC transporter ATP-binding protein [Oceanirhabdus sp. W0125-5]WBW99009.1 sugar ABC transporter ATP-binding protein [Oceanirhabdus sp. W0125-5]